MFTKYKVLYKTIVILSIAVITGNLILPNFSFAQQNNEINKSAGELTKTSEKSIETPKDFGEAKDLVIQIIKPLPASIEKAWQKTKKIWQNTWIKWWNNRIYPWLKTTWQKTAKPYTDKAIEKIKLFLHIEIEKRKSIIEQELEKEKQELIEEFPKHSKTLWQKFIELLK